MRAHLVLMGLLSLSACDRREKEMEQARIASVQRENEKYGGDDLSWEATGERHTTFLLVRNYGTQDPAQIREAMLKGLPGLDAGKEEMERDGFTHIGLRDRDTGIVMTKPVAELRGAAAAVVEAGGAPGPAEAGAPVPSWATKPPATFKDAKQASCAEKGAQACCSYISSKCVYLLCRDTSFKAWGEQHTSCK
ncbi:hypothetical protein HRD49_23695 [Corallococcus exiguus]|uniref:hypothetical protein n=1 Tax=Corallococcus TaxID=83461 RepID=UPI000EBD0B29|nr:MULTISPECIES: hypothetical protein [Corallococcus]NRD64763.1 hypothetical protein [Corallococcus exiguus]RKH93616.1 hypothetical protein D7Y04_40150 [Corallococcus sp. AB038B]